MRTYHQALPSTIPVFLPSIPKTGLDFLSISVAAHVGESKSYLTSPLYSRQRVSARAIRFSPILVSLGFWLLAKLKPGPSELKASICDRGSFPGAATSIAIVSWWRRATSTNLSADECDYDDVYLPLPTSPRGLGYRFYSHQKKTPFPPAFLRRGRPLV